MLQQLLTFVYPKLCWSCERELRGDEKLICLHCETNFAPLTFKYDDENPVFQLFWGKTNVEFASACFHFIKGEKLQSSIHELKYKGQKNLACFFANKMAEKFKNESRFNEVDVIISVPSSPKKIKQRGYNQAEELAKELAKIVDIPYVGNYLVKSKNKQSQTNKSVWERYENMLEVFEINKNFQEKFNFKHVLLVDDVVTTGATLEACATVLIQQSNLKVSILTLAYRNI